MTRKLILAAALAGFASSATVAFAQDIILAPEEEVIVREYVVKQPRAEVVIPDDYGVDEIVVGSVLPDTVTVRPLDAPGFSKEYEYVVIEGRTVLVDPDTRTIVKVMD
jgi:hypothetical protein